jgi:hypothetical protein
MAVNCRPTRAASRLSHVLCPRRTVVSAVRGVAAAGPGPRGCPRSDGDLDDFHLDLGLWMPGGKRPSEQRVSVSEPMETLG